MNAVLDILAVAVVGVLGAIVGVHLEQRERQIRVSMGRTRRSAVGSCGSCAVQSHCGRCYCCSTGPAYVVEERLRPSAGGPRVVRTIAQHAGQDMDHDLAVRVMRCLRVGADRHLYDSGQRYLVCVPAGAGVAL